VLARSPANLWRYAAAIPFRGRPVTFGEGMTPLLPARISGKSLYLKLDYLFPTGSFKDRGAAVMISQARTLGVTEVVEDSSGNAGASVAAYCGRAGITCRIVAPATAPPSKLAQIRALGAKLELVNGPREASAAYALELARGSYYASHARNPYFLHGTKTVAFEIWEQMNGVPPDDVVVPLGNGTLLLGLWLGFQDLLDTGNISRMPRLHGIQSTTCAPLAAAFDAGSKVPVRVIPGLGLADGIAVAEPVRGSQILRAVRESKGSIIAVPNEAILPVYEHLGRAGLFVEPTSAVALAGYDFLDLEEDRAVVVILTGHGLKTVGAN
jgi:threonine synthase